MMRIAEFDRVHAKSIILKSKWAWIGCVGYLLKHRLAVDKLVSCSLASCLDFAYDSNFGGRKRCCAMNGLLDGLFIAMVVITVGIAARFYYSRREPLRPGQQAPDFKLPDQHGRIHVLADFRGKWLTLYFYPKDDTPGCTRQACAFRDDFDKLKALDAEVIGVSVDTVQSHAGFASKFDLPFPLLADATCETAARYQSLINLGIVKFAKRNTFLIDPDGKIVKVYASASARHNASEVVSDLKQFKQMDQATHSA